jgi:hypothetical protein
MVGYNGGLHALRAPEIGAEADVKQKLDEILGTEGVYHADLASLDTWLGTLNDSQFITIADGEESEVAELFRGAPLLGDVEDSASAFINNIYDHCI